MICKKCGANIADASKFCGYCGNKVEQSVQNIGQSIQMSSPVQNIEQNSANSVGQPNVGNVTPEPVVNVQSVQNMEYSTVPQNNNVAMQQPVIQATIDNQQQSIANNTTVPSQNEKKPNKKINKLVFIIGGIALAVIALVLLLVALNKSSNNSIEVLNKALNNFEANAQNSGTIKANILVESSETDSINLSATVKYAKSNDGYNLALTLNKSLLYDEMNLYSKVTEKDITLYAQSTLVDMLGLTSSEQNIWLNYFVDLTDMVEEETEEELEDINLSDIIDEKHFKYINKVDNLNHYQFIIDNELIEKIESQATEEELMEIEESMSSITDVEEGLAETYILDFYINDSDELVKVSMDLTDSLDDESVSKVVISIEFLDFNSTTVVIPNEALNSTTDLETYMSLYSTYDSTEEYDYEYDSEYDIEYDFDYNTETYDLEF